MKTSLLAIATAFTLTLGVGTATFAQDAATTTPTPEECLVEQGAGATPPDASLSATTGSDASDDDGNDNPSAEGVDPDAVVCPDLETTED